MYPALDDKFPDHPMLWTIAKTTVTPGWLCLDMLQVGVPLNFEAFYWPTFGAGDGEGEGGRSFFFSLSSTNVVSSRSSITIWQTWPSFYNQSSEGKDIGRLFSVNCVPSPPHAQPPALPRDHRYRTYILNNCGNPPSPAVTLGGLALSYTTLNAHDLEIDGSNPSGLWSLKFPIVRR